MESRDESSKQRELNNLYKNMLNAIEEAKDCSEQQQAMGQSNASATTMPAPTPIRSTVQPTAQPSQQQRFSRGSILYYKKGPV